LIVVGGAMVRLADPPIAPQLSVSPDVRRFFRMMLPGVIAAGIPQLTLIAGTIVASSSPSAVSWLTYSFRLYELPLGVVSIAITSVMTPAIAAHVRTEDRAASATTQSRAFEIALVLRCRPQPAWRCSPDRSSPDCSNAAHSARATPPRSPAPWQPSHSAFPGMRWRKSWPRCRTRMRTPARRC
jgi:hypothetical protein